MPAQLWDIVKLIVIVILAIVVFRYIVMPLLGAVL